MIEVIHHLLYEINRGLRDLALYTLQTEDRNEVEAELLREGMSYLFRPIDDGRINVYFGHEACIQVVKTFGTCPHCDLTPEQDFILGIMLGYDRARQCERFLERRELCDTKKECSSRNAMVPVAQQRADEQSFVSA